MSEDNLSLFTYTSSSEESVEEQKQEYTPEEKYRMGIEMAFDKINLNLNHAKKLLIEKYSEIPDWKRSMAFMELHDFEFDSWMLINKICDEFIKNGSHYVFMSNKD